MYTSQNDPFHETIRRRFSNPSGPGDSRPTAFQIIKDHNLINNWVGRTVLIIGGSIGLGLETARTLHATGANIYITEET